MSGVLSEWRPRASSSGYFWGCSQRVSFERGVAEGIYPQEIRVDGGGSPYAALGTVIHFILQDGMRAKFPGPAKDFAPTPEEYAQAATLFGGNREQMLAAATASARLALAHVPKLPEGVYWLAEPNVDGGPYCPPGHIDLIASDNSIICDLKTTSRKVSRIKRAALIQLGAYCLATGARKARAIYVDSLTASWCTPIDVDFHEDLEASIILEQLPKLVEYWRGDTLHDTAYPMILGDACGDDFCPYVGACRDKLLPKAASQYNRRSEIAMGGIAL